MDCGYKIKIHDGNSYQNLEDVAELNIDVLREQIRVVWPDSHVRWHRTLDQTFFGYTGAYNANGVFVSDWWPPYTHTTHWQSLDGITKVKVYAVGGSGVAPVLFKDASGNLMPCSIKTATTVDKIFEYSEFAGAVSVCVSTDVRQGLTLGIEGWVPQANKNFAEGFAQEATGYYYAEPRTSAEKIVRANLNKCFNGNVVALRGRRPINYPLFSLTETGSFSVSKREKEVIVTQNGNVSVIGEADKDIKTIMVEMDGFGGSGSTVSVDAGSGGGSGGCCIFSIDLTKGTWYFTIDSNHRVLCHQGTWPTDTKHIVKCSPATNGSDSSPGVRGETLFFNAETPNIAQIKSTYDACIYFYSHGEFGGSWIESGPSIKGRSIYADPNGLFDIVDHNGGVGSRQGGGGAASYAGDGGDAGTASSPQGGDGGTAAGGGGGWEGSPAGKGGYGGIFLYY